MTLTVESPAAAPALPIRINDCAIKLANVNGTGSASANSLLMQAIFRMGIPVSGKNLFPSNIQGLPTWYEIRVNKSGYTARALDYDLMVAMNAQTYARDIQEVKSAGYVMFDSSWPLDSELVRDDVTFLGVPLAMMCNEHFTGSRERILMKNIAYAGAIVAVLGIEAEMVQDLLDKKYAGKEKLRDSNRTALHLGYDFAHSHFDPAPFRLEPMEATEGKILVDGNTATALGAVYAGATVAAWYPITPSTSVMDAFQAFCKRYRKDPETGQNNFMILQAEDELAAIGMVIGANWNGARAFTSTSGPGISLMNELLGLAYYAEIPAVIVDVQRTGPSTGMPTRTQQGDILECAYASHGDTKHILLFPSDPSECFEFAVKSFDLAERFQTPVFMLSDLDIGMNDWVVPRLAWDDSYRPDRGRVLDAEQLQKLERFYRYSDWDEDFIAPRTIPGSSEKGAFFTRGSGHNKLGAYTEYPEEYQEVVDRIKLKHAAAAKHVPEPIIVPSAEFRAKGAPKPQNRSAEAMNENTPQSEGMDAGPSRAWESMSGTELRIGVVTVGGCDLAVREALTILAARGVSADYMRIRAFPFATSVEGFLVDHDINFIVEQNRDGQLRSLLTLETPVFKRRLRSLLVYGGFPLSAQHVVDGITAQLEKPEHPELEGRPTTQDHSSEGDHSDMGGNT
ncbi:MAG TPA: 2-oxoacid:acceptor oxidoreductase subunit alpha [Chloroflexota bacterium]|jgi:2-oxoglutarate ferredoxin oxidoreductase subunit alpha|nr:2-oxoacid:acceptor oxidoreductase subunit alpha [Chloroflexota bacterium]